MSATSENTKAPTALDWREAPLHWPAERLRDDRIAVDAALLVGAAVFAELAFEWEPSVRSWLWLAFFVILAFGLLHGRRRSAPVVRPQVLDEVRLVATTTALAGMAVLSLRVLVDADQAGALGTARQWLFAALALGAGRVAVGLRDFHAYRSGDAGRPTLIVGAGKVGRLVARRLSRYPQFGLRPIGFLDDAPLDGEPNDLPVLGGMESLDRVVDQYAPERVIVTFSAVSHDVLLDLIRRCEQLGVETSFVPRLFETMKDEVRIDSVGSLPLVSVVPTDPRGWQFSVKHALDRIVALVLLVIAAPVMAAAAVAVWLSTGRPILFRQARVGQDGRVFDMLKFRTMNGGTEWTPSELPPDTAPGGNEGSERHTPVGSLLRRTSIDEVPQLLNVLRGEMSLIGPRPERPDFARDFERTVHRYGQRHRVRAGITGWAQVNGLRGNTSLSDRAEWDNYYIDNWSLWLDFKILVLTAFALVRFRAD